MKDRKVGVGWEQEKRARERGISAADGTWGGVGADIEKSLLGLDSRAGTKKVGFREGGTRHTHRHTDIYIYI